MNESLQRIEEVLRLLDREIWIVAAADGERRGGLTATWVMPASIDPDRPLMLVGIGPCHFTAELIAASRRFALHLLREDQAELALAFALDSGRARDKLAGLTLVPANQVTAKAPEASPATPLPLRPPVLSDCLAWMTCRVVARYDSGDRHLYWAEVEAGQTASPQSPRKIPLRERQFFAAASPEQRAKLLANRQADAAILRPLHEAWRKSLTSSAGS